LNAKAFSLYYQVVFKAIMLVSLRVLSEKTARTKTSLNFNFWVKEFERTIKIIT